MATQVTNRVPSPRSIPPRLLRKYGKNLPRYTSYPTAPQFSTTFDVREVETRWRGGDPGDQGVSLYVHIPFCRERCGYCGCHTFVGYKERPLVAYVDAILDQADYALRLLGKKISVAQLTLGGGTPNFLSQKLMSRLVEGIAARFPFVDRAERSIEIDPRWIGTDYLDTLLDLGFNRFSFGVQDLDATVQRNVGRILTADKLARLVGHLVSRGCTAFNFDLIYGLPGQTPDSFGRTVEQVVALRPSRIAIFGYAHVPWVSPHQKKLERFGLPGPALRMELFGRAFEKLLDAGWRHIGMDHFALPDDELVLALESRTLTRNFMGYTTRKGLDLLALGASGISSVGRTYTQNEKEVTPFIDATGTSRWVKGVVMSDDDVLRREVIMGLMCNFRLDMREIERSFGIDFRRYFAAELGSLSDFVEDGLLEATDDTLAVVGLGRFFVRNMAAVFDTYIRRERDVTRRYSKTL